MTNITGPMVEGANTSADLNKIVYQSPLQKKSYKIRKKIFCDTYKAMLLPLPLSPSLSSSQETGGRTPLALSLRM